MTYVCLFVFISCFFFTSMRVRSAEVSKPFQFTGDFTAIVRLRYPDATPACVGKPYKVVFESRGGDGSVTIQFGKPPRKRLVHDFEGLSLDDQLAWYQSAVEDLATPAGPPGLDRTPG